jgi:hypothetical protein
MIQLTEENVDLIQDYIDQSSINIQSLKDDLLDHFCCVIEIHIGKGFSFDDAFKAAIQLTAPEGLDYVQNETIFLLNYNRIIIMKRLAYLLGFIFSLAWLLGVYFKLSHLPGANIIIFTGMSGVAFVFVPLLLLNRFKGSIQTVLSEKLKWIFGSLGIILFTLASWMKIMHLQGAPTVLGLAFLVLGFGFLPFLFFRMYKKSLEKI